jgi:excisionase family DNA binding protein
MQEISKCGPLLVSKRVAAEALSVSLRTIDNLISSKRLPSRRIGKRRLIPYSALANLARTGTPMLTLPTNHELTDPKGDVE